MKISRKIDCPYCGVGIVYHNINLAYLGEQEKVLTCNLDEEGCDRTFVIKLKPSLNIEVGRIEYDSQKTT